MNTNMTVLIQATLIILFVYFIFRLIKTIFRIARSLEGIDETLYQIHNKLEDKSDKNNDSDNN